MWHTKTAQQNEALRALGITAAKVEAQRSGETPAGVAQKSLLITSAGLGIYIENIATDFYSAYHRWFPHRPANWRFLELKKALDENPADGSAFVRVPGLADQDQLAQIERRLTETVRDYASYHPIFFNLGDETGIADLSAAWDFDFSAASLSAMRVWLKQRYGTLAALNQEWSTQFRRWDDVIPTTTTQAMARTDDNYASWSDFKEWMDVEFARAIGDGTKAIHAGANWARSAIEGGQRPGWGGYDYSLLAPSVDVMEIYDDGSNLELAQSFNPGVVLLTTPNWAAPNAQNMVWNQFLRGARGMVLWDPKDEFVTSDAKPGSQARAAAPFIAEMKNGIGTVLGASRRHSDRVAILYSPASFRIQWMLDHRALGADWTKRSAGIENEDNAERVARRRAQLLLGRLGFAPIFVSDEQIASGLLRKAGFRMLVLPQALALSPLASAAIRDFVRAGGSLAADGAVGLFDSHGKRLHQPLLWDLFGSSSRALRLSPNDLLAELQLSGLAKASGLVAEVSVRNAAGESVAAVKQYVFDEADIRFVALLAVPASDGVDRKTPVYLELRSSAFAYDARTGAALGHSSKLAVDVGSRAPTVIALAPTKLPSTRCKILFHLATCPT
jgi:hypothetical protein